MKKTILYFLIFSGACYAIPVTAQFFHPAGTNNTILNNTGHFVGIGINSPNSKLHINTTAAGQNPLRVAVSGSTKLLVSNNGNLFIAGNTGIGTTSPESKLHIFKGNAGSVTGHVNASLIAENSTHNYLNILAPETAETGVLFGKPTSNVSGGLIYNNSGLSNGLQFRTNGNITRMVLTSNGDLGIGTTNPDFYKARVSHGGLGFNIHSASSNNHWEQYIGFEDLALYYNGTGGFRGSFDHISGVYTPISDGRLKTNIKPMTTILDKVKELTPSTYQFKIGKRDQDYIGFVAQDVMKVFPSIVYHHVIKERNLDVYTMDYSQFGTIAIKAIQELQPIIEEQKEKIEALEAELQEIRALLKGDKSIVKGMSGISLAQNSPNPAKNVTTLRYSIPEGSKGQINIYSQAGSLVKTIITNASGQTKLNVNDLTSGIYTYTLIVNGKVERSKKLVIIK